MTPRAPGPLEAVRIVAGREVRERLRSRAVRWGTVVMVLGGVVVALLPRLIPEPRADEWTVAVVGEAPAATAEFVESLAAADGAEVTLVDRADAEEAARDPEVDVVLVEGADLLAETGVAEDLVVLLSDAVGRATAAERLSGTGVDNAEVLELFEVPRLEVRSLTAPEDRADRQGVAFLGTLVLLMAILTYGGWVMNSVLEEKANRIVEIVVSAVRPSELLAAKVLGVGAVGLGQLVAVAVAATAVAGAAGTVPDLPDGIGTAVVAALMWFVLGFGFYSVAYAAAGSLTNRQEDAGSAATPVALFVLAAYIVSVFLVNTEPTSTAATVVSYIPPITPLAMPVRMANDAVGPWGVALAVVEMVVATWLLTRLAARVYTNALLQTSGRVRAGAALRTTER